MSKQIIVGVCGGIAAYKAAELVRLFIKNECDVRVVMTQAALQFIQPLTFEALTNQPVYTSLFADHHGSSMEHIDLARWADQIIIAPATADIIARLRCGIADDLLTTLCLASNARITLAPAMNTQMWLNAATRDNLSCLVDRGMRVLGPDQGIQACGETGPGRMLEVQHIFDCISANENMLNDVRILLTAGPTREAIDPVRFLSNQSSGKMGYALAQAASEYGAEVTLVSGPVVLPNPRVKSVLKVETARQMFDSVMENISNQDIFISCAAVSDYTPKIVASSKLKKGSDTLTLELTKTADILSHVAETYPQIFTVGFAAETDDVENYARAKLKNKKLNMMIANQVGVSDRGFNSDNNAVTILWEHDQQSVGLRSKQQLAKDIIKQIAERYVKQN